MKKSSYMLSLLFFGNLMFSGMSHAQIIPENKSLPEQIQKELKAAGQFCEPNISYRFAIGIEGRIYAVDYNAPNCNSFCNVDGCRLAIFSENRERGTQIAFEGRVSKYEFKKIGLILAIDIDKQPCVGRVQSKCSRLLYLNGTTYVPTRAFPSFNDPRDLVAALYKKLDNPIATFDRDLFDAVFTRDVVALLVLRRAIAQSVSTETFETPWFSDQDGEPSNIRIETKKLIGNDALVQTSYNNSAFDQNRQQRVDFYLRKTTDGWRIADVKWPAEANNKKSFKDQLNEALISDALSD